MRAPAATQRAAEPTAASAGAHSHNAIGFELDEAEDGRRLAWCRDCDLAEGAGTIVDLQDRTAFQVTGAALSSTLPPAERALHPGEFVEYNASAAFLGAAEPWVQGLRGWPLMCQTVAAEVVGSAV